jgi:DNA-binding transcriptional ArsR family regulator
VIVDAYQLYNLAVGVLSAIGLVYLAYSQRFVLGYRRFFYLIIAGFLVFSIGGPLADLFAPSLTHAVHGFAALLVIFGLYDPVHNDLRKDEWARLLLQEPSELRHPGEWMVPMDDELLELFHSVDLVLTPSIIAYNIDRSREEVNRRLSELEEHGLVERVERGKYRITDLGERYLLGTLAGDRPTAAGSDVPH